jgi:hypothetical protein
MNSRFKYPRTSHLAFSQGIETDDHTIPDMRGFEGQEMVITLKMDGHNVSLFQNEVVARSMPVNHQSFTYVHELHQKIQDMIPTGFRICGESVQARHGIKYDRLPSYFLGFSIWNDKGTCLSWDDTLYMFRELGITPVQVLHRGPYNLELLRMLGQKFDIHKHEGFVVRVAGEIHYKDFLTRVAKFVRPNHPKVELKNHWVPNKLA